MNKIRLNQSLNARVMALMGSLFFILWVLLVGSILYFVYSTVQETWRARQSEAARNAAREIQNYLHQNETALVWLDKYEYIELASKPEILDQMIAENPAFLELLFVDANGKPKYGAAKDQTTLANQFTTLQSEWFLSANEGQKTYTRVQTSPQDQSYTIFAMPSTHGGVLAAQIQMDPLWDRVADIRFGESGRIYIVNQNGQVIAHPDKQVVISNRNISETGQFNAILQAPGQKWIGDTVNFDGINVVSVSMPIEETDWIVISELPQMEAFSTTYQASLIIPLIILILMVIAMFTFRDIFHVQVLDPLSRLQRGTSEISHGNLSHRIAIQRNDELGKVMAGFNAMTSDLEQQQSELQAYANELEARVQERTAELILANENLSIEVHEKEILLKEIHHRVKNNLQVISSLFNLQARQVRETGTLQILRDSQTRVRSMALIHEKLYQSKNLARINFGEYVQSLSADLFHSYQRTLGGIELKVQVDEVFLDLDQAIPCGLILNELMTNALKYAFPGGRQGTIKVELHNGSGDMVTLLVMDDGVGLPSDLDIHKTNTLGWQLINSLVAQLSGTLSIENTNGTCCGITFRAGMELS